MPLDLLPYLIASDAAGTGATTIALQAGDNGGWPAISGDAIIVAGGSGGAQPTGVTDTQSNAYTKVTGTGTSPALSLWTATAGSNGLKAPGPGVTPDTITVTYSGTGQAKQWIAVGCQGVQAAADSAVTAMVGGTSATPSVPSGTPTQSGELVLAVFTHQNAAGATFQFNAPWIPIALNVNVGANAYASMGYMINRTTSAVTATANIGSSVAWNGIVIGLKMTPAWAGIGKSIVGASIFSGAYPGLGYSNYQAKTAFDGFVSRVSANRACKRYLQDHEFETAANPAQSVVDHMINHGIFCVVSVKPTRAVGGGIPADITNLRNMYTYWKNNGCAPHVVMGNEANINGQHGPFGDGATKDWVDANNNPAPSPYGSPSATQTVTNYQQWFAYYGPTAIAAGLQCQFNPALSSSGTSLTFIPPRTQSNRAPLCTGVTIDYYYSGDYSNNSITMSAVLNACNTATPPMPAGLGEWGATNGTARPIQDDINGMVSWMDNQVRIPFQNQLAVGAQANLPLLWYANGTGNTLDGTTDSRIIAAYQRFFDGLDPTSASAAVTWQATAIAGNTSTASGSLKSLGTALQSILIDTALAYGTLQLVSPAAPPTVPVGLTAPAVPRRLQLPGNVYRFLTTDTVTGRVLADSIPIVGQTAQRQINSVGAFNGSLTLPTAGAVMRMVPTWMNALRPWRSILWILQNGTPIWHGPITAWNHQSIVDGTLPIQAATIEEFFKHRQIDTNFVMLDMDVFEIFRQELLFALGKTPNGNIAGTGRYANQSGIVDTVQYSGVIGSVTEADSLKKVYDCWNDLVTLYGLEYALSPAITSNGSLYTQVQLGLPLLGRKFADTQFQIVFPSKGMLDYAWPWSPANAANRIIVTGSGGGDNPVNYQVASTGSIDGMPLLEESTSFSGTVASEAQIQQYADSLVNDYSPDAYLNPTVIAADNGPQVSEVQLGDEAQFAMTSSLHPADSRGRPGYMGLFRLSGWTLTFPSGEQPEMTTYSFGAGDVFSLGGG